MQRPECRSQAVLRFLQFLHASNAWSLRESSRHVLSSCRVLKGKCLEAQIEQVAQGCSICAAKLREHLSYRRTIRSSALKHLLLKRRHNDASQIRHSTVPPEANSISAGDSGALLLPFFPRSTARWAVVAGLCTSRAFFVVNRENC